MHAGRPADDSSSRRSRRLGPHGGPDPYRSEPDDDPAVHRRAPVWTIKRMSGGGRFLTRGLRAVKAEAALSLLAFHLLHAMNAIGTRAITPSSTGAPFRPPR